MTAVAWACLLLAASPSDRAAELGERRAHLREKIGETSFAVVLSGRPGDEFRQDRDFLYLTGLEETVGAALLLDPANQETPEVLYLTPRDKREERWTGAQLGPGDIDPETGEGDAERQAAQAATGIGEVAQIKALDGAILSLLRRGRTLLIAAEPIEKEAVPAPAQELWRSLKDRVPGLRAEPLRPHLNQLRMIKSGREVEAIEHAARITMAAERAAAPVIRPGAFEHQVRAAIEYVFTREGGGLAFPTIVGSGLNSTVLHYRSGHRELQAGDLVVVDIGSEWEGYAADITRTYPASGHFSAEQRAIYDLVLKAQEAALAKIKPGAKLRSDVHAAAKKVIEEGGYKSFFPHGTSHHVGLEVHDPGERDGELKAGMVITVEPGIYLPKQGFGVRIEDMVLVTRDGYRLLSGDLPRKAEEVEALMAAAAPTNFPAAGSSH